MTNRTYSRNHEGGKGLTLCSTRSADGGRTWSALRPVEEPETEREGARAVPLPAGRHLCGLARARRMVLLSVDQRTLSCADVRSSE